MPTKIVPCKFCNKPTFMLAELCDRCWELKTRIEASPGLARTILNSSYPNETMIMIIAAFEVTMQTFADVWNATDTTDKQCLIAYGGASAMLLLLQKCGFNEKDPIIVKAKEFLNDAAPQLGLHSTN